jgi:hypothetical protein
MGDLSLIRMRPGRKTRRLLVLLTLVLLCVMVLVTVASVALAKDSSGPPPVKTSQGMTAPKLDYKFVWWTFILTFGLLIVYYFWILRISDKEFIKIIEAHFGPKRDGG